MYIYIYIYFFFLIIFTFLQNYHSPEISYELSTL